MSTTRTNTSTTRRRIAVIGAASLLLVGGGVATAAWTTSGTGDATAQATSLLSLQVSSASASSKLYPLPADTGVYPSSDIGAVHATVYNPNAFPVSVVSATVGTITVTPAAGKTCASSNVVRSASTPIAVTPVRVDAGQTSAPIAVPGAVQMITTAPDGCQGATVTAQITVTGTV